MTGVTVIVPRKMLLIFFFSVNGFFLPRIDLRTSVATILESNNLDYLSEHIEIYLYGHQSLELQDNKNILLSTIKYI